MGEDEELSEVMALMTIANKELDNPNSEVPRLAWLSRQLKKHYGLAQKYPLIGMNLKPLKQMVDSKEKELKIEAIRRIKSNEFDEELRQIANQHPKGAIV